MKKILTSLTAAALALSPLTGLPLNASAKDSGIIRNITTMDLVRDMGIGINLGNTFESTGDWITQWGDGTPNAYETAWGSPTITQKMIQGYADAGFRTLRIPVAWSNMMSSDGSYTLSSAYEERVKQVIDWALDADMYVVMNLHWDGGWLENMPTDHDNVMKKYSAIWTQLCDYFQDYSDYLIFESQNEELGWNGISADQSYIYANEINQTFVDIVRSSGGNNPTRHLLISGYNTDIAKTCDSRFQMPSDPAGRCAVSVHYYTPATFAILESDASWGKNQKTWGSDSDIAELNRNFDLLANTFSNKGIPVIVGEYGCPTKNKEKESVEKYLTSVCEAALSRGGICPVLWDITDLHYSRSNAAMKDSVVQEQFAALAAKYCDSKPPEIVGDVNADGLFNVADLVALQAFLAYGRELENESAADLCHDGDIDIFDLVTMRTFLAKV